MSRVRRPVHRPGPRSSSGGNLSPNYYSFSRLGRPGFVQRIKFALDRRLFGKTLRQLPATQLSVLDVGGGAGSQLDTVRACDARVRFTQVVDLDVRAAEVARANGHAFFCGRIEDFEADRTFDLILLLNLIEHVQSPLAVLEKLRSMLKPEGAILVKTPNYDSLDARLFRHRNWGGYHAPRHWVLFTRESFEVLARRAGLRVRSFSYTQGAPFWSTSILFMLAQWGLIRVTKERPRGLSPVVPRVRRRGGRLRFPPIAVCETVADADRAPARRCRIGDWSHFDRWSLLVAIALAVFTPVLFGGRTFYPTDITNNLILPFAADRSSLDVQETTISDYVLYYYPVRHFQAASFRSGHLNLWNPYIFGGQPAFANNASIVAFDPFNLLLLWPNLATALAWRSFLQVVACLAFMYSIFAAFETQRRGFPHRRHRLRLQLDVLGECVRLVDWRDALAAARLSARRSLSDPPFGEARGSYWTGAWDRPALKPPAGVLLSVFLRRRAARAAMDRLAA